MLFPTISSIHLPSTEIPHSETVDPVSDAQICNFSFLFHTAAEKTLQLDHCSFSIRCSILSHWLGMGSMIYDVLSFFPLHYLNANVVLPSNAPASTNISSSSDLYTSKY